MGGKGNAVIVQVADLNGSSMMFENAPDNIKAQSEMGFFIPYGPVRDHGREDLLLVRLKSRALVDHLQGYLIRFLFD